MGNFDTINLIFTALTFVVLWTGSVIGLAAWIYRQFEKLRKDFDDKHIENGKRYDAINSLVIRHETILNRPGGRRGR